MNVPWIWNAYIIKIVPGPDSWLHAQQPGAILKMQVIKYQIFNCNLINDLTPMCKSQYKRLQDWDSGIWDVAYRNKR